MSETFHFKRQNSTFRRAGSEYNDFTSRYLACCYRDREIGNKNSAAPGLSQIVGFSGYRLLTNKEKNEKSNLLSPLPQGVPNRLKRQNIPSLRLAFVSHCHVELCLFSACVFVFFFSLFLFFPLLSTYSTST